MLKTTLLVLLFASSVLVAQERVDLTVAEVKPTNPNYTLDVITLNVTANTIQVQLKGANGEQKFKQYDAFTVPTGATLLHALNIGNFSVNSLIKAVYNRLITDGVITGTISGVPQ